MINRENTALINNAYRQNIFDQKLELTPLWVTFVFGVGTDAVFTKSASQSLRLGYFVHCAAEGWLNWLNPFSCKSSECPISWRIVQANSSVPASTPNPVALDSSSQQI